MTEAGKNASLGALVLLALCAAGWMALKVGALGGIADAVTVELRLPDAAGVTPGASVAVAGVSVGEVQALRLEHDVAVATLALRSDARVRVDAVARVRQRSVLGEKYLELQPVSRDAPLLVDGDALAVAGVQTEIDEMVGAMAPLLEQVDGEAAAEALHAVFDALREDPERLQRMMADLQRLIAASADRAEEAEGLMDHADSTLTAVDASLARLDRLLGHADGALSSAEAPIAKADRVLADMGELTPAADRALARATDAADRAVQVLDAVEQRLAAVDTVLDNASEIDKWEIRRLLREEGILIRTRAKDVVVPGEEN